ncbi:hypothetical protein ACNHUS_14280 [Actinomycetes bacterium M1A6_2h]
MFKLVPMIVAVAVVAGCSSSDSAPSVEATTTPAPYVGSPSVCADLQTIAEADSRTNDPAAQTWEQQRAVVLGGETEATDAFDRAIGDATAVEDDSLADDLRSLRTFTVDTIDAVRSSSTFDDFSARVRALDASDAEAAGTRLNRYSVEECGFPLAADGS